MTSDAARGELWTSGEAYEGFVGRWSRGVGREFIRWLAAPPGNRWQDVGCGTGVLTETVIATEDPASVHGIDPSSAFIGFARGRVRDRRVTFATGAAQALATRGAAFDVVVSGLVLNFVPDPHSAASEFARVLRAGGTAGAYVWDYADAMQMLRYFWDAAAELDPASRELDEGRRCSICQPELLIALFQSAGFASVEARAINIPTVFSGFDDYWRPFLSGRAPAPAYVMSLDEDGRTALRERLRERLPVAEDGSIRLVARAWAVKGVAP